jgi:hypothetical protein
MTVAVEKQQVLHICTCARACGCAYVHVVLLIQHATRMRHIVTSFVDRLGLPHFSTLSHKRHDFRGGGGKTEHKMRVLIFSTSFV